MRIAILFSELSEVGGIQRVVLTQASALMTQGHEVSCYCVDFNLPQTGLGEVHVSTLPNLSFIRGKEVRLLLSVPLAPFSAKIAKKNDILICHGWGPAVIIGYAAKTLYNTRYISYIYSPPRFLYWSQGKIERWASDKSRALVTRVGRTLQPLVRYLDKKAVASSDDILAVSNFTNRRIKTMYDVQAETCYPPVNLRTFDWQGKGVSAEVDGFSPLILCTGRVVPIKRCDLLIEALPHVAKDEDTAGVVFAGPSDPTYVSKLQWQAEQCGVAERIRFMGTVSDSTLAELYNRADVYAYPVTGEDFGLGPVEAMSYGVPSVVWNDGAGPCETVIEGVTGYRAQPYNLEQFAQLLISATNLRKKPKLRVAMKKQASLFSVENHMAVLNRSIERVVGGQPTQVSTA